MNACSCSECVRVIVIRVIFNLGIRDDDEEERN